MQQMRLPCRTGTFDRRRCGRGRHAPVVRTWIRGYCRGSSCSRDSSSTKPCSSTNRWTLTAEVSLVRQGVSSYSLHSVPPDIYPVDEFDICVYAKYGVSSSKKGGCGAPLSKSQKFTEIPSNPKVRPLGRIIRIVFSTNPPSPLTLSR